MKTFDYPIEPDIIQRYLPHRPPMLMIDSVISCNETQIETQTVLDPDSFFFKGHFPEQAMMPGVMIVETIAQAGALLSGLNGSFDTEESLLAFTGIDQAKFKKSVYPNETLCVFVEIVKRRRNLFKFQGRAEVDGQLVTQTSFSAASMPRNK